MSEADPSSTLHAFNPRTTPPPFRHVVCFDGTGHDDFRSVELNRASHICRIVHEIGIETWSLNRANNSPTDTLVSYIEGVGSSRNGIFNIGNYCAEYTGSGISKTIRDGYAAISKKYRPGDEIVLFGYSRGAFAAKILAGVITDVGILKVGHLRRFVDLFRAYRSLHTRFTSTNALGRARETLEQFRSGNLKDLMHKDVKIKCLGLFDTVSAIGAPLISTIDNYMGFDHFNLPNEVEHAFHCLALNETFPPFILEKWRITEKQAIERAELNRPIKQIWFPGVHGEIGGSKGSTKWSDVTLLWMLANIVQYGIFEFNKAYSQDIINRLIASRNERFSSLTRTNISRTVPTIFDKCTHEQYHKSLNDVANFQDIKANANRVQNLWAELLVEEEEVYPNNEMTTSTLPEHLN